MNRRDFLKLGLLGGASLVTGRGVISAFREGQFDRNFIADFTSGALSTRSGALELYKALDRILDRLEPLVPDAPTTLEQATVMMYEIVPYFQYEGIQDPYIELRQNGQLIGAIAQKPDYPDIQMMVQEGGANFHVLGKAACYQQEGETIWLNVRYFNPWSPMHTKVSFVWVLVHELAHAQDASCDHDNKDLESATQMATCEVLAAMSRHRNPIAFPAFLSLVHGFVGSYLQLSYMDSNDWDSYERDVVLPTANNEWQKASYAKSKAFWENNQGELHRILQDYGAKPYTFLSEAMASPLWVTRDLGMPNRSKKIRMDDTAWVLGHMEALARDYEELLR